MRDSATCLRLLGFAPLHGLLVAALALPACTQKDADSQPADASTPAPSAAEKQATAGTLDVGETLIGELTKSLIATGLTTAQADIIAKSARKEVETAAGTIAVETKANLLASKRVIAVAPAVVAGATKALADPAVALADDALRAATAGVIVGSTVSALKGNTEDLTTGDIKKMDQAIVASSVSTLPAANLVGPSAPSAIAIVTGAAVAALPASGVASADAAGFAGAMTTGAVTSLPIAQIPSELVGASVGAVTSGVVANLGKAGVGSADVGDAAGGVARAAVGSLGSLGMSDASAVEATAGAAKGAVGALTLGGATQEQIGAAAQKVASGTVNGCGDLGVKPDNLRAYAGAATSGAISGLSAAGVTGEQVVAANIVGSIIQGSASGAAAAGIGAEQLPGLMGAVSGAAVGALQTVDLLTTAAREAAVSSAISGSMSAIQAVCQQIAGLMEQLGQLVALSMQAVAAQSVAALPQAGFSTTELASATKTVVKTGVDGITSAGITDAAGAISIAQKMMTGALEGAASLAQSGAIGATFVGDLGAAATSGALSGLDLLKSSGVVASNGDINAFTDGIKTGVQAGLSKSGLSAEVVASIQASTNATANSANASATPSTPASPTTPAPAAPHPIGTVTYNGNGNTGGAVPTDVGPYDLGTTVSVLGNTGALVKTGYTFAGWNTAANGSGTPYSASASLALTVNTTLYAQWAVYADVTPPTLTGLMDDATANLTNKTWTWGCSETGCKYRFKIDKSPTSDLSGVTYTPVTTAKLSYGVGTYYLHIQAKDAAGNESGVEDVSAQLNNANGPLDTSFNSVGYLIRNDGVSPQFADPAVTVAVQADGKILSVNALHSASGASMLTVYRFNVDGSLDTAYGNSGYITATFNDGADGHYNARSATIQPDGKLLVSGYAGRTSWDFFTARLTTSGQFDTSFGTNGIVLSHFGLGGNDEGFTMLLQPDGKILVGGMCDEADGTNVFGLIRLNANGSVDTAFGTNGHVKRMVGPGPIANLQALALQADGKIVAAGDSGAYDGKGFALIRYGADGSVDTSFGTNGTVFQPIGGANGDWPTGIHVDGDGKILVTGHARFGSSNDYTIARFTSSGALDTSFGAGVGYVHTHHGTSNDDADTHLAVQADGRLILIGRQKYTGNIHKCGVVRYNSDGTMDESFGTDGLYSFSLTYNPGLGVALGADGKINMSIWHTEGNGRWAFAVGRLLP